MEDQLPTYQYACTECGHAFEQFQSFSDDTLTVCPQCEGRLRKVYNAVGVVFKGSGFYRTDSRTEADKGGSSSSSKDGGTKEGGGGGKDGGSSSTGGDGGTAAASSSEGGSAKTDKSGGDKAGSGAKTTGSTSAA